MTGRSKVYGAFIAAAVVPLAALVIFKREECVAAAGALSSWFWLKVCKKPPAAKPDRATAALAVQQNAQHPWITAPGSQARN